jgi:ribonuclease BN (tRNA processing enzyme)
MELKILGCSGGIGGLLRTTSMLLDNDVLIDAGTGVGDLSIAELQAIDHVFVTHAHLDHICSIPFIVDTVGALRDQPLNIYATSATLAALRAHIFNNLIWPDFSRLPSAAKPYLRYCPLSVGETVTLGERRITALPAEHLVPAVGYHLRGPKASLVFTGDTTSNDALWAAVNFIDDLRYLLIETAFSEEERDVAIASKHLCPSMLADELKKLEHRVEVYITHLKPGEMEQTMRQVEKVAGELRPKMLETGHIFSL